MFITSIKDISYNSDVEQVNKLPNPKEKWHKPVIKNSSGKKGKYLSPSGKRLNFNPEFAAKHQKNTPLSKNPLSSVRNSCDNSKKNAVTEQSEMNTDCFQNYGLQNIESAPDRRMQTNMNFAKIASKTTKRCCICRQAKSTSAVQCLLCQEYFHVDCINFNEHLTRIGGINYFCINCIYVNYIPSLNYVYNLTIPRDLSRSDTVAELHEQFFCIDLEEDRTNDSYLPAAIENPHAQWQIDVSQRAICERGMVNKKSNCWLSSVLHCLSSTPLLFFLNKLGSTSSQFSLVNILSKCLENLHDI